MTDPTAAPTPAAVKDERPGYRAGWCIHYRPPFSEGIGWIKDSGERTCKAGVVFDEMQHPWPCFLDKETLRPKAPDATPCAFLRPPTREEADLSEAWLQKRIGRLSAVMKVVAPWRAANKGRSHAEVIECPICKGRLHLSIAACNGHVHGQCETPDCVGWME